MKDDFKEKQKEVLESAGRIKEKFELFTEHKLNDKGLLQLKHWVRQFGEEMVMEALEESVDRYYTGSLKSAANAFIKIGGICYNWSCVE